MEHFDKTKPNSVIVSAHSTMQQYRQSYSRDIQNQGLKKRGNI